VRSKEEILATLGPDATHANLPFMPEMFRYCGQRFQVYKRADKTCDTINNGGGLRMRDTVHLIGTRCDGSAHGGCEAGCFLFWREAWVKRPGAGRDADGGGHRATGCSEDDVNRAAIADATDEVYRCQATQLLTCTEPLKWWDVRQYARDFATNGMRVGEMASAFLFAAFRNFLELGVGYRALIASYDWFQARRGGTPFPIRTGSCEKTPTEILDLKPGEFVRVKSYLEILATLDRGSRNRGLWFDPEMVQYCGNTYRVMKRVRRILNEKTGKMLTFSNPCIVLQDVFCRATKTKYRLFCPRANLTYWREIWLERVTEDDVASRRSAA
jgi:hypothetical protein